MMSPSECRVGFVWSSGFDRFNYGHRHPIQPGRFAKIKRFAESRGFLDAKNVDIINAEPVPHDLLELTHSSSYLSTVKEMSRTGVGSLDSSTPAFKGMLENARLVSGATVSGIKAILDDSIDHFFSPTGGFHHASYESGGGFCIINDIAAAVYELKRSGICRILIADFDAHHGNGTQSYFYADPDVMCISFHEDPEWLFPHEGHIRDIGADEGKGLNINMHFPIDSGDEVYRYAYDEIVPPLVESYKPEFIIFLPGFDTHYLDRLTHLNLTTKTLAYITSKIHDYAHEYSDGNLGVVTGGGYTIQSLEWGVGCVLSILTGVPYEPPVQVPPFQHDDDETWNRVRKGVSTLVQMVLPEFRR